MPLFHLFLLWHLTAMLCLPSLKPVFEGLLEHHKRWWQWLDLPHCSGDGSELPVSVSQHSFSVPDSLHLFSRLDLVCCVCPPWYWPHSLHPQLLSLTINWVTLCFSPQRLHVLSAPWAEARAVPAGSGARAERWWAVAGLRLEPPSQV